MTSRRRQNADAAFVERVVETRVDDTGNCEGVNEILVRSFNNERRKEEIGWLEAWARYDDRLHREDLLAIEGGSKPNGDQSKGRHYRIADRSYRCVPQSICLRMNVGISMSLRSCSGDDRSLSGVTAGLLVGVFLRGSSRGPTRDVPFPLTGRSGITGAPRVIAGGWAMTLCGWVDAAPGRSKPVAITVTLISPCIAGSCTAPKMISASSPTASWMISLIWWTSPSVRSAPPVMFTSTPIAPEMLMLSSNGLEMACCAASIARFSPRPMPVPMSAEPPLCMTVRTSAKSTFTSPVTLISEEIP